jgi:hypothetical protein
MARLTGDSRVGRAPRVGRDVAGVHGRIAEGRRAACVRDGVGQAIRRALVRVRADAGPAAGDADVAAAGVRIAERRRPAGGRGRAASLPRVARAQGRSGALRLPGSYLPRRPARGRCSGFEVPMHDPGGMRLGEAICDLRDDAVRRRRIDPAQAPDALAESSPWRHSMAMNGVPSAPTPASSRPGHTSPGWIDLEQGAVSSDERPHDFYWRD